VTQAPAPRWGDRSRRYAILALHAAVFGALIYWSWRKWPDPLIDFGRELYVPWEITRGRVLYRDIASLFGPLSPYVNALWFQLFGVSLMTLVACNLAIFAAMVAGIYHLVRISTDRVTASAASLSTLLLFGFSQYGPVGNYNFVCPYSHEATHGMASSVAMLVCLQSAIVERRKMFWAMGGVCFGLAMLTKPEIGLAASAAAAAGIGGAWLAATRRQDVLRGATLFAGFAIVPALLFFLYFATTTSSGAALRAVGGAWMPAFDRSIAANAFYLRGMGFDAPAVNFVRMVAIFAGLLIYAAAAVALSWTKAEPAQHPSIVKRLGSLALLIVAVLLTRKGAWPLALPLVTLSGASALVWLYRLQLRGGDSSVRLLPLVMWSAFALVLLAKMGLYARFTHYGFYLALPATVLAIVVGCGLAPQLVEARVSAAAARRFRQIALGTLAIAIAPYLGLSHAWYWTKTVPIGSGGDRFFATTAPGQETGGTLPQAQQELERLAAPGATIAVLPEGVMLNYLMRRDSPLRLVNFMPPELIAFGENEIIRSLEAAPPDFVLLVHKDTSEYGDPRFGIDPRYGLETMRWVNARYRPVRVIGRDPLSEGGFGMVILRR
jgi:hypothetical protein